MTSAPIETPAGISVVIPVKGRVEPLARLLSSLPAAIARCPEPAEVIVVDDPGSAEERQHRATCARYGARYVIGESHVGVKRNIGVREAKYDLVFFVDSDCRADQDLLARHVAVLRAAPDAVGAVTGPTLLAETAAGRHSGPGGRLIRVMRRSTLLNGDHERPLHFERVSWGITANLAVKRQAFLACGGFPHDSPHPLGGEDVELGLRMGDRGYATLCDADAVVWHDSTSSDNLRAIARRLLNYGRSEQWLCTVRPERRQFKWNRVSLVVGAALAAASLVPRTRGRSLVAVPAVAAAAIGIRAARLLGPDRAPGVVVDALACSALETLFELGAVGGAIEHRDPRLLFAGFRPPDDSAHRRARSHDHVPAAGEDHR